jgi:hypothetical protein
VATSNGLGSGMVEGGIAWPWPQIVGLESDVLGTSCAGLWQGVAGSCVREFHRRRECNMMDPGCGSLQL